MKYVMFSLDCELGWGLYDQRDRNPAARRIETNPDLGRRAYQSLLTTFEEFDVPATWALVGHLFLDTCSRSSHHSNDRIDDVDPYSTLESAPFYYGRDLVDAVSENVVDHEIAGHGFSHSYFDELSEAEAREELTELITVVDDVGADLTSFVYPRNRSGFEALLPEFGIEVFRGRTVGANRTFVDGVKAATLGNRHLSVPPVRPEQTADGLVQMPASRLLAEERWWWIQPVRLLRSLRSMAPNSVLHLTMHPHDFVSNPRLLRVFRVMLRLVRRAIDRGTLDVLTLGDSPMLVRN